MEDFAGYTERLSDWEKQAKTVAQQYDGKNENELLKDIFARAIEGKRNGTLTDEQIDAFYKKFSPMLDGAKRKKLQKLIAQLKRL